MSVFFFNNFLITPLDEKLDDFRSDQVNEDKYCQVDEPNQYLRIDFLKQISECFYDRRSFLQLFFI